MEKRDKEWTADEAALLDSIICLLENRLENGYPEDSEEFDSSGDLDEIMDKVMEELHEIRDNGRSFLSFYVDAATGNVKGMMGME